MMPAGASARAVERSVSGRCWRWRDHDAALALEISQRGDLPEVIGRILAARGVRLDGVPAFIQPRLRDALPDPSHLLDLERAVERLAAAVEAAEPVGLLGDYDVDGATSLALLARYLQAVGGRVAIDVPDRLAEGYGPNPQALARLAAQGCRLVVTAAIRNPAANPATCAAYATPAFPVIAALCMYRNCRTIHIPSTNHAGSTNGTKKRNGTRLITRDLGNIQRYAPRTPDTAPEAPTSVAVESALRRAKAYVATYPQTR